MDEQALVLQEFNQCTIIVHVGKVEDIDSIIQSLVDSGLLTQAIGDQLMEDEAKHES